MSRTFVLIHGTWHGGWAWDAVIRELSEKGHRAHAPTLAGHGPGAAPQGITHQDCVASVVAYIDRQDLDDVVLVGHSFGGTVVQKATEKLFDRIRRTVFLDALILEHNERVFDVLPAWPIESMSQCVFLDTLRPKDGGDSLAANSDAMQIPPWETWRDNFIQDAPESMARSTWQRLSPEPSQVNLDKLDLRRFCSLSVPKSFIFCRHDKAMPAGYFHPQISSRLGAFILLEMDGSHEVMFTRPAELADKIVEQARTDGRPTLGGLLVDVAPGM
jgi:pimeloyl-ACP methyl ester carboxylesterase